jgi:hypothetical protein
MIVICGDFNINYLAENDMMKQLDAKLISYNLTSGIDFLTRFRINPVQQLIPLLQIFFIIATPLLFPRLMGSQIMLPSF